MKRRDAIQQLALAAASFTLFPGCDFEEIPTYTRIPIEKDQYRLIRQLADYILPLGDLQTGAPESTVDYILTIINDCYSDEALAKYLEGLNEFELYLIEDVGGKFEKLEHEEKNATLVYLSEYADRTKSMLGFYESTKQLTVEHFTSSPYFLKNHLDFEFAPGRYLGCVPI